MAEAIRGAEQFAELSKRFKEAGRKDLRIELYRGINRATKPLKEDVKKGLEEYMPNRYAVVLRRKLKLTTSKRTSAKAPGVIIRARADNRLDQVNDGNLRHPLWGMRKYWFDESIKPGFFSDVLYEDADKVADAIQDAMDEVAKKIEKG